MSLLSQPVLFDPFTGSVQRTNPVPLRAREYRQTPSANNAVRVSGIGRVDWDEVEAYVADWEQKKEDSALAEFIERYRLATKRVETPAQVRDCFLATNAKTNKPRKATGQIGQILGLALFPHFYPNILNAIPSEFLDDNGVVNVPQVKKTEAGYAQLTKKGEALRVFFNNFDGTSPASIEGQTGVPRPEQLNFCTGASPACRSTCLVLSGNNPASTPAVAKKANLTQAFLTNPPLFVAGLYVSLDSLSRTRAKTLSQPEKVRAIVAKFSELKRYTMTSEFALLSPEEQKKIVTEISRLETSVSETVVRLNMLSDLPWYSMCPELLERLADPKRGAARVYWYDYTKVPFWTSADYAQLGQSIGLRPADVLDLTFSFSGGEANESLCRQALDLRSEALGYPEGVRVAAVFAPFDPERRATVDSRTTWGEILTAGAQAGMVSQGDDGRFFITLPVLGTREIVDGDESDYRIDDPGGCIVALNFKEPSLSEEFVPGIKERVRSARKKFTLKVPTMRSNPSPETTPDYATGDAPEALAEGVLRYAMFKVGPLLIGPHVPTVLDD
jgi:hypothetical protein